MKKIGRFIVVLALLGGVSVSQAEEQDDQFEPYARRAQYSAKLIGITIRIGCPTPDLITEVEKEAVAIGADYTQFPEIGGAFLCSSTIHGPMWGKVQWDNEESAILRTATIRGGVVVGLHYRVMR